MTTDRTGHKWTKAEDESLLSMYSADKTIAEISFTLNRSEVSIKNRLLKFNKLVSIQKPTKKLSDFVPQENKEAIQAINSTGRRNLTFFIYNKYVAMLEGENGVRSTGLNNSQIFLLLAVMDALQSSACHFEEPVLQNDLTEHFYKSVAQSFPQKSMSFTDAFTNLAQKPFWTLVGKKTKSAMMDRELQMLMLDKETSERLRTFLLSHVN